MALDQPDAARKDNAPAPSVPPGVAEDVYAFLAQANLLRMRGRWEEATEKCMAALRLAPESASAQSLLGDIYENQARYDDAAQWYRMALDVNPDSPADRLKLDRLLARPGQERDGEPAPPPVAPGLVARLVRDPEAALRAAALTVAVLVCLVVLLAYGALHRRALASLGLGDQEVTTKPVVVPSAVVPPDPDSAVAHDPSEAVLLNALRNSPDLSGQGIVVYDVQTDPRTLHLTVTFGISPDTAGGAREPILRDALRTLQAAAGEPQAQSVTAFTARCLLSPAGGVGAAGAASPGASLAFVGDLPRASLPPSSLTAAALPLPQLQGLFGNVWWSPQVAA